MKIFVKTKPDSKYESVKKIDEFHFEVCVKEPPVQGKANAAVIKALSRHFRVPLSSVRIAAGHAARQKIVEVK